MRFWESPHFVGTGAFFSWGGNRSRMWARAGAALPCSRSTGHFQLADPAGEKTEPQTGWPVEIAWRQRLSGSLPACTFCRAA
jgi:hypothetical protein